MVILMYLGRLKTVCYAVMPSCYHARDAVQYLRAASSGVFLGAVRYTLTGFELGSAAFLCCTCCHLG